MTAPVLEVSRPRDPFLHQGRRREGRRRRVVLSSRRAKCSGSSASRARARASPASRSSGSSIRPAGSSPARSGSRPGARRARRTMRCAAVRGRRIAMVFQDPMMTLNPVLTIADQMRLAIAAHEPVSAKRRAGHARSRRSRRVGMPDPARRLDAYPHQFSGGMRQRVAIAIALLHRPAVIIVRRADDRARRLDPGADPDRDAPSRLRARHGADLDQPRSRRPSRRSRTASPSCMPAGSSRRGRRRWCSLRRAIPTPAASSTRCRRGPSPGATCARSRADAVAAAPRPRAARSARAARGRAPPASSCRSRPATWCARRAAIIRSSSPRRKRRERSLPDGRAGLEALRAAPDARRPHRRPPRRRGRDGAPCRR